MPTPNTQWLIYALASGAFAALNGVFAKLTTTSLTTTWATALSHLFGFTNPSVVIETLIRGFFFAMNLAFNAVMWGLFTRALTLASSTVRVSVINTSANFGLSAVMGWLVFGEGLPGLWWLGAAMLVAGSVIIGRRDEGKEESGAGTAGREPSVALSEQIGGFSDEPDAPVAAARDVVPGGGAVYSDGVEPERKVLRRQGSHSSDET